ncbi:MAG: STAS domain-containing protein [Desulfamplus sp.]|nr:STAS domain-containing protein [Desulfamplus sp.]
MDITIAIQKKESFTIAHVAGRIDTNTSDELEDALMDILNGGEHRIILDLEKIDYISSAGIRVLLVITKQLYASGELFCVLSDNVLEIIEMAGLNTFMNICDTVSDAEAAMG